jgi:UDP-glucuronate 4-epimerase
MYPLTVRILVTGAAGFIGSTLSEYLHKKKFDVLALDALLEGTYPSIQKRKNRDSVIQCGIEFVEANLCELRSFPRQRGFDVIIHCAAMPGLSLSWETPEIYIENNISATSNLIKNLDTQDLKKFLYISTSSVYGRFAVGDETSPTRPISPYGVTKLAAENMLLAYLEAAGIPVSILRIFSVFGPRQRTDMMYSKLFEAAKNGSEITIFGDGTQSRSNTYVDDIVHGIEKAMLGARVGEIYNIGGGEEVQLNEVIKRIEVITKKPIARKYAEPRLGDQYRTVANFEKARNEFGYDPKIGVTEGLNKQYEWLKSV